MGCKEDDRDTPLIGGTCKSFSINMPDAPPYDFGILMGIVIKK